MAAVRAKASAKRMIWSLGVLSIGRREAGGLGAGQGSSNGDAIFRPYAPSSGAVRAMAETWLAAPCR